MPGSQLLSFDPDRPDFTPYGLTCVHWQPSPMQRPDHHSEVELNFLKSGSVTYLLGGQKATVEVGKLSVFWAANPHQIIDFSADTDYIVATIPLQCFLQWRLPDHFVQPLMRGEFLSEPTNENSAWDVNLFEQWVRDLQENSTEMERPVLLEMQARLTRFALKFPAQAIRHGLSGVTDSGLNKVERMACFIAQNYTQKLTVQQIGDFVKLNPNYAMNLFQKTFGTTLINYITQHRVSHAQRLLTTTDKSITDIALQSGFLSISRFNDAFCRTCGCSPREYRKSHQPGPDVQ
jgi:AraC-like DNA-binding protein